MHKGFIYICFCFCFCDLDELAKQVTGYICALYYQSFVKHELLSFQANKQVQGLLGGDLSF